MQRVTHFPTRFRGFEISFDSASLSHVTGASATSLSSDQAYSIVIAFFGGLTRRTPRRDQDRDDWCIFCYLFLFLFSSDLKSWWLVDSFTLEENTKESTKHLFSISTIISLSDLKSCSYDRITRIFLHWIDCLAN